MKNVIIIIIAAIIVVINNVEPFPFLVIYPPSKPYIPNSATTIPILWPRF